MRMNNMNDYQKGAKNEALCAYCKKSVPSTLSSETLSICKGLEEVENVLVRLCDKCGNMITIPARSMLPIQQAAERLIDSKLVSKIEEVTVELKTLVDKEKMTNRQTVPDYQYEYPMRATG